MRRIVNNANGLVDALGRSWQRRRSKRMLADLSKVPEAVRTAVRNNVGGHWNHTFFWELMTPGGAKEPAAT